MPIGTILLSLLILNRYASDMEQYDIWADALNKFSQLTPWVQVAMFLGLCAVVLGVTYLVKEMLAVVMSPFKKETIAYNKPTKEWKDSYYRDS